jgi:hypothetical protein
MYKVESFFSIYEAWGFNTLFIKMKILIQKERIRRNNFTLQTSFTR